MSIEAPAIRKVSSVDPTGRERGRRIPFGQEPYNEIMDFLIVEARMLDDGRHDEWLNLLADDIHYRMPVRTNVYRREGDGFETSMYWLNDKISSIRFKVHRVMDTDCAWAEDPPSRTRRLVTNMILYETATPGEFLAETSIYLQRNRGDASTSENLTARRDDIVRRGADGWRLASRTVWVDQASIGMPNLAVYL